MGKRPHKPESCAYVDSPAIEEINKREHQPQEQTALLERTVEENQLLFEKMTSGVFNEGEHVLRAKIDMSSANMLMRDPVIYRVLKPHPRTKNEWCVYPMYDWAHGQSDYIEQISHSLCTL